MSFVALPLSRILLSLVFLYSGYNKVIDLAGWKARVATLQFMGQPLPQAEVLAYVSAFAEIGCAVLLFVGLLSRLAAFGLIVFTIAASVIMHNFWAFVEPAKKSLEIVQFTKNLGLVGGLLLIVAMGGGALGIDGIFRRRD